MPEYDLPEYTARPYKSGVQAASPSDFSALFPSSRRLLIRHDDATEDGNMNLRLDTEVQSDGEAFDLTLFHLRMHDLKNREFSLRRYCRDSGREVCHSTWKSQPTEPQKRPGFQRSLSNALSVMRPKSEVKAPTLASLRRNDSGYSSMHSVDFDAQERPRSAGNASKNEQLMSHTMKMEFSNYAQVDVTRVGAGVSKRYEFEYWGTVYSWKRVIKMDGDTKQVSFHLTKASGEQPLAHITPVPLTRAQARQEELKGGWIPPCTLQLIDERIIRSQKDILSDRRGGRTAWSCQVSVGGQNIQARFWYDGQYVNNAREDAAECALQFFGQLPSPQGPQPRHLQQQQQRGYGAVSS
nr:hypothetical protein B0A51_17767 [Rachicladosporium sp. CCFEE 5018]